MIYIIRGANYEYELVLFASLDKGKRDEVFKAIENLEAFNQGIACEDIPLEKLREYAFDDWHPVEYFTERG